MANNRMVLVCKDCNLGCYVAKFYPSTGWFRYEEPQDAINHAKRMNDFFEKHKHDYDASSFGGCQYELRYEIDGNEMADNTLGHEKTTPA